MGEVIFPGMFHSSLEPLAIYETVVSDSPQW